MEKKWTRIGEGLFQLFVSDEEVGSMQISTDSTAFKADCQFGDQHFTIQRTGFWKSNIEIIDQSNSLIGKVYKEKWYANSSIFEYANKKYKIVLQNNPLAELLISDDSGAIFSYGIKLDDDQLKVVIAVFNEDSDLLLDFLMWYLFAPIVLENSGDNFVFQLLLTAQ